MNEKKIQSGFENQKQEETSEVSEQIAMMRKSAIEKRENKQIDLKFTSYEDFMRNLTMDDRKGRVEMGEMKTINQNSEENKIFTTGAQTCTVAVVINIDKSETTLMHANYLEEDMQEWFWKKSEDEDYVSENVKVLLLGGEGRKSESASVQQGFTDEIENNIFMGEKVFLSSIGSDENPPEIQRIALREVFEGLSVNVIDPENIEIEFILKSGKGLDAEEEKDLKKFIDKKMKIED